MKFDDEMLMIFAGVILLLSVASIAGAVLKRRTRSESGQKVINNLIARVNAWWVMVIIFFLAMLTGGVGSVILFGLTSFLAFREFITLTPTARGDHRTLFWAFFVIIPLNYIFVAYEGFGIFTVFIPVYAFLFIPIRNALAGDIRNYLERTAKIQWALMVTVYCVAHAPAILKLEIPGYEGENAKLLFFFVFVVQISDVLQYVWGKTCGRRPIAPKLSPNKTIEGFIGGVGSATLLGTGLWWITPFSPLAAAGMSLLICVMGFFGGLVMSSIKRDRGVKDYGTTLPGHGGIMDRIDSLCFAAPIFFHLTRYFYVVT
jgi:phosphatidate cytidylyltransferase